MREVSIKRICQRLTQEHGVNLEDKVALDFFAREGDWQTQYYAEKVEKVYAWEVNPSYEDKLKQNLPNNAVVTIGNSFDLAAQKKNFFDIVVLDNPQGCFGKDDVYCEHFEALETSFKLLKEAGGILIFNIKTEPFNYAEKLEWQNRRNNFYSLQDASLLTKEFVIDFYKKYFSDHGYTTKLIFLEKRPQENGLYALAAKIQRKNNELD